MPLTEVTRQGREGFEVFTLFLVLVALVRMLVTGDLPPSIDTYMPYPWYVVWATMGILGAVASLLGIFMQERSTGLLVEQFSLVPTSICAGIYALVAYAYSGTGGLLIVAFAGGFAATCLRRWWKIQVALKRFRALAEAQRRDGYNGAD